MRHNWHTVVLVTGMVVLGATVAVKAPAGFQVAHAQVAITPKTQAPPEARALSRAFAAVSRALAPSVVRLDIETEKRANRQDRREQVPPDLEKYFERFFGHEGAPLPMPGPGRGTGSGVVLDGTGNILTNSHVVENAAKVTVTFSDGREFPAKVVGRDPQTDVAVVRMESAPAGLVAARLGDSGRIEVGEWVLAIGSPLGLDQSVTAGIVSGKGRVGRHVRMSGDRVREYIQTDAKINPGNSGGPLVNLEGEVIGINTLINAGPGGSYGFAIPISHARRVAQTIISDGRVRHAFLGVGLLDVRDGVRLNGQGEPDSRSKAKSEGPPRAAWVTEVRPGSPAARAGVQVGDVITKIDNQKIESANDVVDYVSSRNVGAKVTLAYQRDGRPSTVNLTLGELPSKDDRQGDGGSLVPRGKTGIALQTLTPEMARFLGLDADTKGAVVTEVVPGSPAAKSGLRTEDVIVEVNRKVVGTAEAAAEALRQPSKNGHLLRIRRGGAAQFITVPGN